MLYNTVSLCVVQHCLSVCCTTLSLCVLAFKIRHSYVFLIIKPTRCTISQLYFGEELYVFRTDLLSIICGTGTVVGIATGYGLDGPGSNPGGGRDFPHLSRRTLGPTQPPVQWVPGLTRGVKRGRGVTLTPHLF